MILTLRRQSFTDEGVFGLLLEESGDLLAHTLEHAYDRRPKLPDGEYVCRRGTHQLEHSPAPFETFEITGVPGHSNILFHVGNTQDDSHGCVLLGMASAGAALLDSRVAFRGFLAATKGVNEFTLVVKS